MAYNRQLTILDLPIDILTLILQSVLFSSQPVLLCPCSVQPAPTELLLPILLIHPSLHAIACPLFYAANLFSLDLSSSHHAHTRRIANLIPTPRQSLAQRITVQPSSPLPPLLLLSAPALRRIHRLSLTIDRLRGWLADTFVPLLQDLIVNGSLTQLELRVVGTAAAAQTGLDAFAKPPLGRLLLLLADPDLREARLWVEVTHGRAWCDFHEGECALTREDEPGMNELVEVKVDWKRLLRQVDAEARGPALDWNGSGNMRV